MCRSHGAWQEPAADALEVEVQELESHQMWVLGTELGFSGSPGCSTGPRLQPRMGTVTGAGTCLCALTLGLPFLHTQPSGSTVRTLTILLAFHGGLLAHSSSVNATGSPRALSKVSGGSQDISCHLLTRHHKQVRHHRSTVQGPAP